MKENVVTCQIIMVGLYWIVAIIACAQALPEEVGPQFLNIGHRYMNVERRIARDGYFSESHSVLTRDGYILEINRIPFGRREIRDKTPGNKPVVFLMHGLQSLSLCFITLGQNSLAYNLADNGFDVWMGNARGVMNSRNHLFLNPDNPEHTLRFFDYSFEDIGMTDVPTMIDFVLRTTGKSQLHYIGHSQGGTSFLVMTSMFPEYNQKIASAHLLAGVGYQDNFPNKMLTLAAQNTFLLHNFAISRGVIEIFGPNPKTNRNKLSTECNSVGTTEACSLVSIFEAMKYLEAIGGASIKQYAHYGQNIDDKRFRRWNFINPFTNLLRYGSLTPPEFDISKITIDVTMHYSVGDNLLDEQDVLAMADAMPNTKVRRVARDSFSHTDFVIARDSKELVTDYIIEQLRNYENL